MFQRCSWFLIILLFGSTTVIAQTFNICDGPYVFYDSNKVIVRSFNSDSKLVVDSFPLADADKHPLSIEFSNHKEWNFSVRLKKHIEIEDAVYNRVDTVLAVSDIEGEFKEFRSLLIGNKVMDSLYRWTFGKNELVICGDLFDRGKDVVQELWLLYKLEDEAKANGGIVHTLLGNHDIMNLSGDFRYVSQKYTAYANIMGIPLIDLYTNHTELGQWLVSKNLVEKVDNNLCLHAGISQNILSMKLNVDSINNRCRPFYRLTMNWQLITKEKMDPFFGDDGPVWYRGYFVEPKASQYTVNKTLSFYQCKRIVIGHTIVKSNIAAYYQDKVIGIDVDEHAGNTEAIMVINDKVYTTDITGVLTPIKSIQPDPAVQ
jgi:hypothetical protein